MGREVRRVPANWNHPRDKDGYYIPLHEGPFSKRLKEWNEGNELWQKGLMRDFSTEKIVPIKEYQKSMSYSEWDGRQPESEYYMPEWTEEEKTHLMMYETCSEGTPISPAFKTPEELAHWLADNNASAFGSLTATYEEWLETCKDGYAIGAVWDGRKFISGVSYGKGDK